MSKKTTEEPKKTDFQGAVSLDAIFAAKNAGEKSTELPPISTTTIEEIKEEVVEPAKPIEPAVAPKAAEVIETVPQTTPNIDEEVETEAFKTAKRLIGLGILEDFTIQTSEEDKEGTSISEFKTMSDENLEEIIKIHKQEKDKEISSKYLPKGDLKEHQLKVFEILSNGGDLSQIAETPEKALERPFEGFDMEDQKRQIDVRYTDLVHSKGLDHESAITIINKEVKDGTIKNKAAEIFDLYRDAHTKYVDDILENQRKDKEFKDLNFKENKKTLTAKLKEAGFKENVYKKVSSEYSKKNADGDFALIDKLREALENPEDNYEVILHLTDKKLFNETFKIKASTEAQRTIVRLASGAASKGNRQTVSSQSTTETQAPWLKAAEIYNSKIKK